MRRGLAVTLALAVLITMGFTLLARADDNEPTPGVARVSLTHGDVSTQRGDSGDWVAASINAPIVAGDWVTTGKRSRTELQLDFANVLRLGDDSEAKVADLTRTRIQVQVRRGIANFSVFKESEADVEIDTPNVAVRPVIGREGVYRIEVISEDETRVIVRKGEADVTTPQGSTTVKKGDLITIRGRDNPEYQVSEAPRGDSWDDWNKERDHQILDAESYGRTNRYYTGVSDLDRHGHWIYADDYGWVWSPYGGPGWAPYRYGRWVWEPYWGWTWVSYEPWGWAPYHYGRWFLHLGSWCWWPGPVYPFYRPLWAPAYVSFFGFGHHVGVGVGFGFGSIGWLPIGPRDYYYPWWGGHRRNINVVNITNITNVTNIYRIEPLGRGRGMRSNLDDVMRDARLRGGVTTMASDRFGREAVPRSGHRVVTPAELRQGQLVAGNVPVVPTRESLRPVDRVVNRPAGPARDNNRDRFFTRSQPTTRPEDFHSEAAQMRDAVQARERPGRGPNGATDMRGNIGENANPRDRRNETPNVAGGAGRNPQVNREPNRPDQRPQTQASEQSPGWRRFGDRRNADAAQGPARNRQTPASERGQAPAREPRQAAPQRETPSRTQVPAREPSQSSRGDRSGWEKFTPRDRPSARPGNAPENRRSTPDRTNPSEERRPNRAPSADERPGYRPFTPQPDRSERQTYDRGDRSDYPRRSMDYPSSDRGERSDSPRRSSDYPSSDRGYRPDRAPSAGRKRPQGWDRPAARESGRRPIEMQRPIMVPRAERGGAPSSGRQGGGQAPRGNNPPPRQSSGSSPRQRGR